jgi:hypothetical protein
LALIKPRRYSVICQSANLIALPAQGFADLSFNRGKVCPKQTQIARIGISLARRSKECHRPNNQIGSGKAFLAPAVTAPGLLFQAKGFSPPALGCFSFPPYLLRRMQKVINIVQVRVETESEDDEVA